MKFLASHEHTQANIYGHTYSLRPIVSPDVGLKDVLVVDDGSAMELLKRHPGVLSSVSFEKEKISGFPEVLKKGGEIRSGSRVLILRSGGIGDHIMFTAALRAFREQRLLGGTSELWLSTQADMFPIFEDNPAIDKLLPLPLPLSDFLRAHYIVDLSGFMKDAVRPDVHLTDYYMGQMGLDPNGVMDKTPFISANIARSQSIKDLFQDLRQKYPGKFVILLNWFASTHIKKFGTICAF